MNEYSCEICQKIFTKKHIFDKHINRKRPCKRASKNGLNIELKIDNFIENKIDDEQNIILNISADEYAKKTRDELIIICKRKNIKGYSKKKKNDILKMILENRTQTLKDEPINISSSNKLRMADLFSGTGAFTLAFQETGAVDTVFSNDIVEHSKKIYDINFNHKLTLKDLNDIKNEDIQSHDILTGGFPCQPFSIAGLQEGFKDERSNVFWKILSIIDYHRPKCVILENVKNLINHDKNKTFSIIKSSFEERGYYIHYKVLNTSEITGIPHHRERVYIVCIKSKNIYDKFSLDFPKVEKKKISEFLEISDIPSKYYYSDKSTTWELVKNNVLKKNTVYQYRRVYVRENKSSECPTLTANMGAGGHNVPIILDEKGIRKLTPRECFNLQGFASSYILPDLCDSNLYKLAGNAVSVPIVKLIADRIIPLLQFYND